MYLRVVASLFLLGVTESVRDETWRTTINHETGRVHGHVDHPHWVDLQLKSFHIEDLPAVVKDSRSGEVLSNTSSALFEYIVKLKAPVKRSTIDSITALIPAHGWHLNLAKNTLLIFTTSAGAGEISEFPGVMLVHAVSNDLVQYIKLHRTVYDSTPEDDTAVDVSGLHLNLQAGRAVETALRRVVNVLNAGGHRAVEVQRDGEMIVLRSETSNMKDIARFLVETQARLSGDVISIEHPLKHITTNKFSREVMSTGTYDTSRTFAEREPYAHLSGKSHVVGIADTGIDHDHCFFHDEQHPTPLRTQNDAHRKIVLYKPASFHDSPGSIGDVDAKNGHGTHIAGTIAGSLKDGAVPSSHEELRDYHGFVPEAKLVFIDMTEYGDSSESVNVPPDIKTNLFQYAHDAGARVHSNSWGSNSGSYYAGNEKQTDSFMRSHDTDLVLFAAGNEADKHCKGSPLDPLCDKFTVMSPSTSKSAVCVGASMAPLESWEKFGLNNTYLRMHDPSQADRPIVANFSLVKGSFGHIHITLPQNVGFAKAKPHDACAGHTPNRGRIDNRDELKGKIAIVDRGTCFFAVKIWEITRAGAAGVIIVNTVPGDAIVMGKDGLSDEQVADLVPGWMISQKEGAELLRLVEADPDIVADVTTDHLYNRHKNADDMSEFSSRGPTFDFRFKPDVVAIGYYVHSARSDSLLTTYNCDLAAEMGTSMATPEVSALTVQISQYLQEYHTPKVEQPSGSLLKAMLIQSAVPLTGEVDRNAQGQWEPLRPMASPTFYQGHGRVTLSSILQPLDTKTAEELFVLERSEGVGAVCIKYNGDSPYGFRATLAWTDAEVHTSTAHVLVNDLDLVVQTPDGTVFYGNSHSDAQNQAQDRLNTAEKVTVHNAEKGAYRVDVKKFSEFSDQKYSLVASGVEVDISECAAESQDPMQNIPLTAVPYSESHEMKVWDWKVFKVERPDVLSITATVSLSIENGNYERSADVDIFIREGVPPTTTESDAQFDAAKCRLRTDCHKMPKKTLVHNTKSDIDVYYVAVHVGCCHEASFKLDITTKQEDLAPPPVIHSIAPKGTTPVTPEFVFFNSSSTLQGGVLVVKGEHFGNSISAVSLTYTGVNGSLFVCTVERISDTEITCLTAPASFGVSLSKLTLVIHGYKTVSNQKITFQDIGADRYKVLGLRTFPCAELIPSANPNLLPTCQSHGPKILFNNYIASQGRGDVYIMGLAHIGERMPGTEYSAAKVFYEREVGGSEPEHGGRLLPGEGGKTMLRAECTSMPYVRDSILHCETQEGSTGDNNIVIEIFGITIKTDMVLSFAPAPQISGLSIFGQKPTSKVFLSYEQVHRESGTLFLSIVGTELGIDSSFGLFQGKAPALSIPDTSFLNVSCDTRPSSGVIYLEVMSRTATAIVVALPTTLPAEQNIFFTLRMSASTHRSTTETAVLFVMGVPELAGLTTELFGVPETHLLVPYAKRSEDIYLLGKNLGGAFDEIQITFSIEGEQGGIASVGEVVSASQVKFTIPEKMQSFIDVNITVALYLAHSQEAHFFSFTVGEAPTLTGVSATAPTDSEPQEAHIDYTIDGKVSVLYLSGKVQDDLFAFFGGYECKIDEKAKLKENHFVACVLDPQTPPGEHRLVAFYGEYESESDVTITVTRGEGAPAKLPEVLVSTSSEVIFAEVRFVITSASNEVFVITREPCYRFDLTRFKQTKDTIGEVGPDTVKANAFTLPYSKSVPSVVQIPYNLCFANEGFYYPVANARTLYAMSVHVVSFLSGKTVFWTHQMRDGADHLGDFPPIEEVVVRVRGGGFTKDTMLSITSGDCSSPSAQRATFISGGSEASQEVLFALPHPASSGTRSASWTLCFGVFDPDTPRTAEEQPLATLELGSITTTACYPTSGSFDTQCSANGKCTETGTCECNEAYRGENCELMCPLGVSESVDKQLVPCSDKGVCNGEAVCECDPARYSANCAFQAKEIDHFYSDSPPLRRSSELVHTGTGGMEGDWHLYHVSHGSSFYLHLTWRHPGSRFDILVWNESNRIGDPSGAKASFLQTPEDDTKVVLHLNRSEGENLFFGVYGSCQDKQTVPYVITLSGDAQSDVQTPAPLLSTVQEFAEKYEGVARMAGFLLGALILCICLVSCRIFVGPCIAMMKAQRPMQMAEDASDLFSEMSDTELPGIINDPNEGQMES